MVSAMEKKCKDGGAGREQASLTWNARLDNAVDFWQHTRKGEFIFSKT